MALLFSFMVIQPCPCQEKSCMVGVDMVSFIRRSACIDISYGFNEHWSATGEASVSYESLIRKKSALEQEHDAEFTNMTSLPQHLHHVRSSAMIRYWPRSAFLGPYISVGLQSDSNIDFITEAGYSIPIWKGISLSTAVRIPIIQSMNQGHFDAGNIRIGLQYRY